MVNKMEVNKLTLMTRVELIDALKQKSGTAIDLSKQFNRSINAIEEDIEHIRTSLRTDPDFELLISPAMCLLCDYQFPKGKAKTPSKCPKCKREKIQLSSFKIDKK
ncbi:MAG: hypothetical protein ACXAD7_00850 [Candidatus Kariarchaeaceae archaeon]|jgi:predicted Zn-ribbon and HTH transcriptional regulator